MQSLISTNTPRTVADQLIAAIRQTILTHIAVETARTIEKNATEQRDRIIRFQNLPAWNNPSLREKS